MLELIPAWNIRVSTWIWSVVTTLRFTEEGVGSWDGIGAPPRLGAGWTDFRTRILGDGFFVRGAAGREAWFDRDSRLALRPILGLRVDDAGIEWRRLGSCWEDGAGENDGTGGCDMEWRSGRGWVSPRFVLEGALGMP